MQTAEPLIIVASLMRMEGATGVQTHMREFHAYLSEVGTPHRIANPFYMLAAPLLYALIALRRVFEWCWPPAAVWLYRHGHGWLLWCRLQWLLRRHAHCVVYAQCPVSAEQAMRCLRSPLQRVVLVVHFNVSQADEWTGKGMISKGGRLDQRIRALERRVLSRLDGVVYVSEFMRHELLRVVPELAQTRQAVIPNFLKAIPADAHVARVQGRDLVSIGTLEARKNQVFLLKVLAEARRRGRELSLTLVGDGPDRGMLTRFAADHGIANLVHFEGFSANARLFIPGHRLCVHAAEMETQGIVLLEALSAGVPVVAAAVGGIVEVFDEGIQGRFWPLNDAAEACSILLKLLDDEPMRARMSAAAVQRFQSRFEAKAVGQQLASFLQG